MKRAFEEILKSLPIASVFACFEGAARVDAQQQGQPARQSPANLVPAAGTAPVAYRDPYGAVGGPPAAPAMMPPANQRAARRVLAHRQQAQVADRDRRRGLLALGALHTLMKTPLYTATVRLQIDRNVAKVVEGGNVTPVEGTDMEFLRTQYELLQSRAMAERVACRCELGSDADFFKPRDFSILGAAKDLVLDLLQAARPRRRPAAARQGGAAKAAAAHRLGQPHGAPVPARAWSTSPIPTRARRGRSGSPRPSPTPSSPPISTSASRPTPTPRPSSRTSSSS